MIKSFTLGLLSTLAILAFGLPAIAGAVQNGGIGGSPAYPDPHNSRTQSIFIFQLKPNQTASNGVKVENNTNQTQTINLDAVDSELASGGAFTCKQAVETKTDVGSWINLQSSTLTLSPYSHQIVPFTITAPSTASVGEHDGCITIQAASQTGTKSNVSGIVLSFRSAIRVVVTIPGKIIKSLSIMSVKVNQAKNSNYQITPTVKNNGNVSLDTSVHIELASIFGTTVQSVNEGSSPVLPRSEASWNYEVKKPFWGGFYKAKVVAAYNSNPSNGLGVNQNNNLETKTLSSGLFFVMPKPAALLIEIIILVIVIGLIYLIVKRVKQNQEVSQNWEEYTVKKDDTLQTLASKYSVSWRAIARANKLKPPYHIDKGQKLKLPVKKG